MEDDTLQRYKDFQPTGFDSPSNFMAHRDIDYLQDWFVCPTGRNRDSSLLDESNWDAALKILGGESDKVEVHRFGHWAYGWYELILVHPSLRDEVAGIESLLTEYALLDDSDYSERVFDRACELWENSSTKERIEYIRHYGRGVSLFAARRDEMPDGISTEFAEE